MKLKHVLIALFLIMLCAITVNTAPEADAAAPTYAYINHNLTGNQMAVGGSVTFTFSCNGTTNTLWIYNMSTGGNVVHTIQGLGTSHTMTMSTAGKYQALVQTWNGEGSYTSSRVTFYVGLPTIATLSLNYDAVPTGTNITFTMTSDGASNTLWIYYPDGSSKYYQDAGSSKPLSFSTPGNYSALLETWNGQGSKKTSKIPFTVVDTGGGLSVSLGADNTNTTVHGNVKFTLSIKNDAYLPVNNLSFKVTANNGSETLTLYTVSGNSGSNGTGTTASKTGALGNIAARTTLTITLTVNSDDSNFDDNTTYNVQISAGSGTLVGLDTGTASRSFSASGTKSFKPTSGSATLSWSSSATSGNVVKGKYTYTVTFKNGTNHSINGIDFTIKTGSTAIVTVSNGSITLHSCASVSPTSLGTVTSGQSATLTVTIDTSKLTAGTKYQFDLAGGGCSATGISGSNSTYAVGTSGSGNHTITVASGTAALSWSSNITSGTVAKGTYTYTVTFKNNTNHSINGIDFTVKTGSTAIVTVTNGSITTHSCATVNPTSLGTLTSGQSATLTITIDTSKLTAGTKYQFDLAGGGCSATGISGDNSTYAVTTSGSGNHTITVANGSAALTWSPSVSSGMIVEGTYTYTVTFKNNTNHSITGIDYTVKIGGTSVVTVTNGAVTANQTYVSVSKTTLGDVAAGGNVQLVITVDATKLTDGSSYTFDLAGGSCNATGVTGSGSGYAVTTSGSGNHSITVRSGGVTMTWTPSITTGKVVEGTYTYKVTFTNNTNHTITGIDYTIKYGNTTVLSVSNGAVTASGCATANKTSLGDLASGASVELLVTIDTTKLTDGNGYTFTLSGGSSNATGIAGSNATIELIPSTNSYSHSITVRSGDVTVTLNSATVNNNGVGEGDVNYTITLKNETNHTLTNIAFALKDSKGNTLLTVAADGTITVVNNTLVKNGGSVSGSLSALTAGSTVTISGVVIDGKADILDADGYLTLVATGTANASDVVGSGAGLGYDDNSDTFTIVVRHDVDLLVQADKNITVNADKILAAMKKSGATVYNGITGISAVTVTDINGNVITKTGFGSNGSNLVINLSAEYSEFIIKVTHNGGSILVPIQVSTVSGGNDKTLVLDYGLPVSIDKATMLDDVRLTGGAYSTAANAVSGFSANFGETASLNLAGTYGSFSYANNTFDYTTTKFIEGEDAAYIVVLVGNANGTENVDFVNVYKKVSFIPSNVIYYEDSLVGSITYPGGYELDALGELSGIGFSGEQDLPITGNMGFDDGSYANAKDVMISGESMHKVIVGETASSVTFSFTGTGFELISRVNAYDAATLLIYVTDPSGATKVYPVITQYDPNGNGNAEIYQVPVFRLNNGAYGTYQIEVKGLPNQDFDIGGNVISTTTSYIYIDGIRVYNPLGDSDLTQHYGNEQGAEFTNIRDLILAGQGTLAAYTDQVTGFTTGSYYYVGEGGKWFTAALGSINELGAMGANNEILIRKDAGNHILVLKVKETADNAGLLQIGFHDVHDAKFDGGTGENDSSSVSYNTVNGWVSLKSEFYSGTEQYYNIDLSKCPTDGGYKIVVLRVDDGFVSFTNVKHKNVEFGAIGEKALEIYTQPGFFFDSEGNMCTKDEDGNVIVITSASELFNLNLINDIMAQSNAENE